MDEVKRARLKGDWKRIEDSAFYSELRAVLLKEEKSLIDALKAESNDRDKDMWIKGKIYELGIIHKRLEDLVRSIGETLG